MTAKGVFFSLYGCADIKRSECPLSDSELRRLQRINEFRLTRADLDFEAGLLHKLDLGLLGVSGNES